MSSKARGRPTNAVRLTRAAAGSANIANHMTNGSSMSRLSQESSTKARNNNISPLLANKKTLSKVIPSNDEEALDRGTISDQLALILNEMRSFRETVEELKQIKEDVSRLVTRNTMLEAENQLLMERVTRLELKEDYREKEEIKQNVVIKGLEPGNKSEKDIENIILEKLGVESKVIQVRKFGNPQREIHVARLSSAEEKRAVMVNKSRLRGSNIFINHDRTAREREIQRKIYKIAKDKEAEGEKVRIGFKSLRIGDKQMIWREGKGLVESFREHERGNYSGRENSQPRSPAYGSPEHQTGSQNWPGGLYSVLEH